MKIWTDFEAVAFSGDGDSWPPVVSVAYCHDRGDDRWLAQADDAKPFVRKWLREAQFVGGHNISADLGWACHRFGFWRETFEAYAEGRVRCTLQDEVLIYGHQGDSLKPGLSGLDACLKRYGLIPRNATKIDPWRPHYGPLRKIPIAPPHVPHKQGWYLYKDLRDLPPSSVHVRFEPIPKRPGEKKQRTRLVVKYPLTTWTREAASYAVDDPWYAQRLGRAQLSAYLRLDDADTAYVQANGRIPGSAEAAVNDFWWSLASGQGVRGDQPRIANARKDLAWRVDRLRRYLVDAGLMTRKSFGQGLMFGLQPGKREAPTLRAAKVKAKVEKYLAPHEQARTAPTDKHPRGQVQTNEDQINRAQAAAEKQGAKDRELTALVLIKKLDGLDRKLEKLQREAITTWRMTQKITWRSGSGADETKGGLNVQNFIKTFKIIQMAKRYMCNSKGQLKLPSGEIVDAKTWAYSISPRSMLRPRDPGRVWIFADYMQQELHTWGIAMDLILAFHHARGEHKRVKIPCSMTRMLQMSTNPTHGMDYRQRTDPHAYFASHLLGIDFKDFDLSNPEHKQARSMAKPFNFGRKGGMGARKFVDWARSAYDQTFTLDFVRKGFHIHDHIVHPEMPIYFRYHDMIVNHADGRMRVPHAGASVGYRKYTDANNFDFQNPAAIANGYSGWLLTCASYLGQIPTKNNTGWEPAPILRDCGYMPVLFVHDEFGGPCPREHAETVQSEVVRLMRLGFERMFPGYTCGVDAEEPCEIWGK